MSVSFPEGHPSVVPGSAHAVNPAQAGKTFPARLWDWLACFRSVQLAIILLSLLALGVLIGVLVPQDGLVEVADIKKQFGDHYRLFKAMGLFNVYSSYWFLTLEVLFFFNLLFGSFQWLRPAFLSATRKVFCAPEHIRVSPNHFWVKSGLPAQALYAEVAPLLRKRRYGLHLPKNADLSGAWKLYAAKGNFGRIGPVVAHFGILLLLVASVFGAFTGFKAQKIINPGESFALSQPDAFMPNIQRKFWLGTIPDWTLKVHDFKIVFYEDNPTTPQQFYADIEVRDSDNKSLARKEISVNHPLALEDVTIYQASFAPTGRLFLKINGEPKTVEVNTQYQDRPISMSSVGKPQDNLSLIVFPFFVQQDPGVTKNHVRVFLHRADAFVGAAPGKMPDNLELYEGQSGTLSGMTIEYVKPEIATGLQIKKAPETFWIYLAFLVIAAGTVMCFFSQRQIWVAIERDEASGEHTVYFHYKTNKARLSFNRELEGLKQDLYHRLVKRRAEAS